MSWKGKTARSATIRGQANTPGVSRTDPRKVDTLGQVARHLGNLCLDVMVDERVELGPVCRRLALGDLATGLLELSFLVLELLLAALQLDLLLPQLLLRLPCARPARRAVQRSGSAVVTSIPSLKRASLPHHARMVAGGRGNWRRWRLPHDSVRPRIRSRRRRLCASRSSTAIGLASARLRPATATVDRPCQRTRAGAGCCEASYSCTARSKSQQPENPPVCQWPLLALSGRRRQGRRTPKGLL